MQFFFDGAMRRVGRSMLSVRQLLRRMHPLLGHTRGDRMAWIHHRHSECMRRSMTGSESLTGRHHHHLFVFIDDQPRTKVTVTPTQADHLVVIVPAEERVVRGMKANEAAAVADV